MLNSTDISILKDYPLIPKEAFLLFPESREICYEHKSLIKRLIFGNSKFPEYTELQKLKINQFIQLLLAHETLKNVVDQNQETLHLKMIYANKYNLNKALENYKNFKEWQSQFIPISKIDPAYRQKMDELLKTGVFYCSATRDQYFKPMLIVHVGRLLRIKPQNKLFLDTFGYFLQNIIDQMMIDGQLETWNVIVDVDQTSVFSFAGLLSNLISFLSRIFIGRMFRCYITNYPLLIKFVWGAVALMMDAEQNQKCRILTKKEMIKLIPKQSLQEKYGGDLPALEYFWPLDSPERLKIQKQSEQKMMKYWIKQNRLVSESEYYQRYRENKVGTKLSKQIIKKFQKTITLTKEVITLPKQISKGEKISKELSDKLNLKIKKQKQPLMIKILDGLSTENEDSEQKSENILRNQPLNQQFKPKIIYVRTEVFQQRVFSNVQTR